MANKITLKRSSVSGKAPETTDLDYGELALNYTDGKLYYKTSSNTIGSIGGTQNFTQIDRQSYTASAGQTTFSITYTPPYVDVYVNGSHLSNEDYTATSGSTIVLTQACSAGDQVDLMGFSGGIVIPGAKNNGDLLIYNGTTQLWENYPQSSVTVGNANKWTTSRTLSFTGDATGSMSVDGSANASAELTLANSGASAGSYGSATAVPAITVDAKGRITSISTNNVTGVSSVSYDGTTGVLTITTPSGTSYTPDLGVGSGDSPTFAALTTTGNLTVGGNLTVNGTTTTINSTTLSVDDLNITLADGAANAAAADGAGITVAGASATFTYASATDRWNLNKPLGISYAAGTDAALYLANSSTAANNNVVETKYLTGNANTGLDTVAAIGVINPSATTDNYGDIYFKTATPSGGLTEKLRLDSGGNLDLKTTGTKLNFSSTGQRITGDFSNATHSNRLLFQSNVTNGNSIVGIIPNGTGTTGQLNVYASSSPADTSVGQFINNGTIVQLTSNIVGTGSYLPLVFGAGGNERIRITTGGDVGIGSTSINVLTWTRALTIASTGNTALEINEGSTAKLYVGYDINSDFGMVGMYANEPLTFRTNNTERARISADGNVGIGITAPTVKLDIVGSIKATGNSATNTNGLSLTGTTTGFNRVLIENTSGGLSLGVEGSTPVWGGAAYASVIGSTGATPLQFMTSGVTGATLDANGNVGIGTTTPGTKLDVQSNTGAVIRVKATGDGTQATLSLDGYAGGGFYRASRINFLQNNVTKWSLIQDYNQNNTNDLTFEQAGLVKALFDSSANFSLNGGTFIVDNTKAYQLRDSGGTARYALYMSNAVSPGAGDLVHLGNPLNDALVFFTNNSEKMRITSAGNVGIGTTAPGQKLQVAGTGAFTGDASVSNDQVQIGFVAPEGYLKSKNSSGSPASNLGLYTTDTGGTTNKVVHISYDGNVEIGGTFLLGRRLNVDSSTDGYTVNLLQTDTFSSGKSSGIVFAGYYDASNITDMASIRGGKENTTSGNYGGKLAFFTRVNGGSDTERVRIASDGNVGIGTTNPGEKLEVNGKIKHSGLVSTDGTDIDQVKTFTISLTLDTTWQDTTINGTDLATGTYAIQLYADDNTAGGGHYTEYYTGLMSWFAGDTNEASSDEIVLHRAGRALTSRSIYLRTLRTVTANADDLKLQITTNGTNTGASNYVFKFRRLI